MGLFGKKTCGHTSTAPFKARCGKEPGHPGQHSARGLRWGDDGRITFGSPKGAGKRDGGGRR